jgi:hypothetical protein
MEDVDQKLEHRIRTGPDATPFRQRVSEALLDRYVVYGSPVSAQRLGDKPWQLNEFSPMGLRLSKHKASRHLGGCFGYFQID